MSSDKATAAAATAGPKLYTNKPKKAQLKQAQASMGTVSAPPSSNIPPVTPPPPPPKESFARRYRFLWPLLITVNLAVGAYIFTRTKKKAIIEEEEEEAEPTNSVAVTVAAPVSETPVLPASVTQPVKLPEPIPEDQQRELFKWLLEEKRKVKAKDPEEKKRIDEEKALLKQFIRAKSIPSL